MLFWITAHTRVWFGRKEQGVESRVGGECASLLSSPLGVGSGPTEILCLIFQVKNAEGRVLCIFLRKSTCGRKLGQMGAESTPWGAEDVKCSGGWKFRGFNSPPLVNLNPCNCVHALWTVWFRLWLLFWAWVYWLYPQWWILHTNKCVILLYNCYYLPFIRNISN